MIVGVDASTVFNWEKMEVEPNLRVWPAVLKFLGYDPRPPGRSIGEKLKRHRDGLGLSQEEVAERMGVDPSTVNKWELQPDPAQNYLSIPKIAEFLGYCPLPQAKSDGERIRQFRLTSGFTQEQLAEKLGVSQAEVSQWERGQQRIPLSISGTDTD